MSAPLGGRSSWAAVVRTVPMSTLLGEQRGESAQTCGDIGGGRRACRIDQMLGEQAA
ncbi:hypothetical protein ACW2Q0_30435 [Nocardia sp. R16R-3T]